MDRPIIGITMGDPAGNGAELSIQALSHIEVYQNCKTYYYWRCKLYEMCIKIIRKTK